MTGIPFSVRQGVVCFDNVPLFQHETEQIPYDSPPDMATMVCAFADRVWVPDHGNYGVAIDHAKVGEIAAYARRVASELDTLMELVSPAVVESVAGELDLQSQAVAVSLSRALLLHRSGVHVSDAAERSIQLPEIEDVSGALASAVGLYTLAGLLTSDNMRGVDVALGAVRFVNLDTGNELNIFPSWPKW